MGGSLSSQRSDYGGAVMRSIYPHIAFCGMDGSGKSTLARMVQEWFIENGQPIEYIHGHTYSVSKTSFNMGASAVNRYRLLFRCISPLVYLDNLYTHFKKYQPILQRSNLVTDRYFYDKICRLLFYQVLTPRMARMYLKLLPRPVFTFVLDIEPSEAYARKAEYTLVEYEIFRRNYNFVANTVGAIVIDTKQSIDVCWSIIRDALESYPMFSEGQNK